MALLQSLVTALYPDQCVSCEALTDAPHGLCGACWRETPFLQGHGCSQCAASLPGQGDGQDDLCDACLATPRPWNRGYAVLSYEGKARTFVQRLKYADRTDLARPAAVWMAQALLPHLGKDALLVPIPAHRLRLLTRRYNQAALIARGMAERLGVEVLVDGLLRTRATRKLDALTAEARFAELDGAIALNPRYAELWAGRTVVIVDDVMTSGATLDAATRVVRAAGASRVDVAVLARTLKAP